MAAVSAGMQGRAGLGLLCRDGQTRLARLDQAAPLRILFPDPAAGDPLTAALVTTSGGLVGGDHLDLSVTLDAGAQALVLAQAAEKVYRSAGPDVTVSIAVTLAENSCLELLPQETILFDGARLRRQAVVRLDPGATFLGGEINVLGRLARGEVMNSGLLAECWDLWRNGKRLWADRMLLEEPLQRVRAAPAGLNGANACATLLLAGDAVAERLDLVRSLLEGRAAAGVIGTELLLVRWLAEDPAALRRNYAAVWCALRETLGRPARLPRLWHV